MKTLLAGLLLWAVSLNAYSADIFLEGISILGAKKNAFVSIDGEKASVAKGDSVGDEWVVDRIERRAIFLRSAKGEIKELPLHGRLGETAAPAQPSPPGPPMFPTENPFAKALQQSRAAAKQPADPNKPRPKFQPRRIPDDEVPPGHRKVSTPFGDVLVKDPPKPKK
ncbi:MAG: hypothetical protein GY862_05915 [Gammaproteobacteria bacterium]|nr:hypothetical protein [Gammaproteobacteria bacterium]